ncbi:MAG: glycosyltransferase [Candidatus Aminicenantes bacterium]|nr:glycosyltransferase [Candidatus Aminicenantes bacterium]
MKVAVDCYEVTGQSKGVGRVIQNLLLSLCQEEKEHIFLAYSREKNKEFSKCPNIKQSCFPRDKGYFRWQNGPLSKELKKEKPDLFIAPNYTLPLFIRSKSILFEHDVSFASHPEWYSKKEVLKRKYLVKRSLQKASLVITLSEFSKHEITSHFLVSPETIKVMHLGVENKFRAAESTEVLSWKRRNGLEGKQIVGYLGSLFNRRNIPLLVESVRLLRREFPDVVLSIVGEDLSYPPQSLNQILEEKWIFWEKRIPESELPLYLSSLDVFAYLSEYEGFGLPPLEALACGTVPVLFKKGALEEVYSGISVMVDRLETDLVKKALRKALMDQSRVDSIMNRFELEKDHFSWKRVAREFKTYMQEVACED